MARKQREKSKICDKLTRYQEGLRCLPSFDSGVHQQHLRSDEDSSSKLIMKFENGNQENSNSWTFRRPTTMLPDNMSPSMDFTGKRLLSINSLDHSIFKSYYGGYRVASDYQTYKKATYSSPFGGSHNLQSTVKIRDIGKQETKEDELINHNDIPFIDFLGVGISS